MEEALKVLLLTTLVNIPDDFVTQMSMEISTHLFQSQFVCFQSIIGRSWLKKLKNMTK